MKNKAIFLDRDGVINEAIKENPCVKSPEEFYLLPSVIQAIRKINESDYLAIIITNQPGIAQGLFIKEDLERVHDYMIHLLQFGEAKIDDIFYCPHHPEKGWPNEVKELKIQCECRKPLPGLLKYASMKHGIDLSQSFFIGDRIQDTLAGQAAGCKTIQIETNGSLLEAINFILGE